MPTSNRKLFDLHLDVDSDPNDVEGNTDTTEKKARRDALALKKRALQSIAENPDE